MKTSCLTTTAADRHAFCALYKLKCDCRGCETPQQRAEREALHAVLRPRTGDDS